MIKSMTGFGRGRFEGSAFTCSVEIKAVNHRFLDLHAKLPPELGELELLIKRWVQSRVKRGRIDLLVTIDRNETFGFSLNTSLLQAYLRAFEQLRSDFGLGGEIDPVQLLRTPGILNLDSPSLSGESLAIVKEALDQAVQSALHDLDRMRIEEGEVLHTDILGRLETIEREATAIRASTAEALGACQEHLQTRLNELLSGFPVDPARVVQEAAFYVERSDITEELTRLESHVGQSKGLLSDSQDVGKTMDFLLQEMNREANTILSKATGFIGCGLEISNRAILIKREIEKIREQIQNVE
jgi:uncharacterized protein (TIGR00255 family)